MLIMLYFSPGVSIYTKKCTQTTIQSFVYYISAAAFFSDKFLVGSPNSIFSLIQFYFSP